MSINYSTVKREDIGSALWCNARGEWELVRVLHRESDDCYFFQTGDHTYGDAVGGYGRDELATLYMTEKLTLSPERIRDAGVSSRPAVIRNCHGTPVCAEADWRDGLEPLLADPDFHGNPLR